MLEFVGNNFFANVYLEGRYFVRGEGLSILKSNLEGQFPIFYPDLRGYVESKISAKYQNFNLDFLYNAKVL